MPSGNKFTNPKHGIDIDPREKKSLGGGFWAAASVLSKKWQKLRQKEKTAKQEGCEISVPLPVEKPISVQYREAESEISVYGFARRSCDIERISFDGPRYSLDQPRASWDGHLMGRGFPRMIPRDSIREKPLTNCVDQNVDVPGGSAQTREYYGDSSSSKRRKSLDRPSLVDELKLECFQDTAMMPGETGLKEYSSSHLRAGCSEHLELGSEFGNGHRNPATEDCERKGSKKSRRWRWRLWGFNHRDNCKNKDVEEEKKCPMNRLQRSLSESWPELRGGGSNNRIFRISSSVSWRSASQVEGSFRSARKSDVNKKMTDDFALERNRNAGRVPSHFNNAPSKCNSWRGGLG